MLESKQHSHVYDYMKKIIEDTNVYEEYDLDEEYKLLIVQYYTPITESQYKWTERTRDIIKKTGKQKFESEYVTLIVPQRQLDSILHSLENDSNLMVNCLRYFRFKNKEERFIDYVSHFYWSEVVSIEY